MLEFGDRPEDVEEHPTDCGGGVDALIVHHQVDAGGLVVAWAARSDCSSDRQSRSNSMTTSSSRCGLAVSRACRALVGGELAGRLVDEDLVAGGGFERVALALGVPVAGGDPRVADPQPR